MQKLLLMILLALGMTTLSSCSHIYGDKGVIKNHDVDYLKAQDIPPLKMPPGISNSSIQTRYPVAQKTYTPTQKRVVLTPPELNNPPIPPSQ
jgi:outer membrane protein assembly factor BamC